MNTLRQFYCSPREVAYFKFFNWKRFLAQFLCIVILTFLVSCSVPPSVFDFDDGTTQGWKVTGVFDDQGSIYTPIFPLSHLESAQYPASFPQGDPLNDKKGCLFVNGGQMGPWVTKSGFPKNSAYWEVTAYYTGLNKSSAWQGIKGVKAAVGDNYGAVAGHLYVNIGVRAKVGGQDKVISELDAGGKPLFRPVNHQLAGKWSHLDVKLNIPPNAEIYQVWVKFRGDWQNYKLYEGGLMIDQVEAVK